MIAYGTGTYAGVMIVVTGDVEDVPAAVQSGLTAQGYTTARAAQLDVIDPAPTVPTATQVADAVWSKTLP